MYWQVYLHKAVLAADRMLDGILRRAKMLAEQGKPLYTTPALGSFLGKKKEQGQDGCGTFCLADFARLDDSDIYTVLKAWSSHSDPILSILCSSLINRQLFRMEMQMRPFDEDYKAAVRKATGERFGLPEEDIGYFVMSEQVTNNAYDPKHDRIRVLLKNNKLADISGSSEELDISVLSGPVSKYILCYPKAVTI